MANTPNLDLIKPLGTDHALVSQINSNMDKIDQYAGGVDASLGAIEDSIAIVANGDTHAAITSGQFVYVRNHSTLTQGLYTATANIAANATLSTSNLTADSAGGLNALNSNIAKKANSKNVSDGLSNIDLNTMKETGIYGIELATNAPAGYAYGTLTVERYDQNGLFVNQTWRDAAQTVVFIRNFHNNSWTAWEELALNSNLTIKKQSVTIGTITLNAAGYADISSYKPNVNVLFATIGYWSSVSPVASFSLVTDAYYVIGSANQQIIGLSVDYFYYD